MAGEKPVIMVVDDEKLVAGLMKSIIEFSGNEALVAHNHKEAFDIIHNEHIDICFIDLTLGDETVDDNFIESLKNNNEDVVLIIVTGKDRELAVKESDRMNAFSYLTKPFTVVEFQEKLNIAIEEWEKRAYRRRIKNLVSQSILEESTRRFKNFISYQQVYDYIVSMISSEVTIDSFENRTHRERVTEISVGIGEAMGLSKDDLDALRWGSYLHDIGMVIVPLSIIKKPAELTEEESKIVRKHPKFGYSMIKDIELLNLASTVVLFHHERYDGRGYPNGLGKDDIPLLARIFAVADAYDSMTGYRDYRLSISHKEAVKELKRNSGTQFDPEVVETFMDFLRSNSKSGEIKLNCTGKK